MIHHALLAKLVEVQTQEQPAHPARLCFRIFGKISQNATVRRINAPLEATSIVNNYAVVVLHNVTLVRALITVFSATPSLPHLLWKMGCVSPHAQLFRLLSFKMVFTRANSVKHRVQSVSRVSQVYVLNARQTCLTLWIANVKRNVERGSEIY